MDTFKPMKQIITNGQTVSFNCVLILNVITGQPLKMELKQHVRKMSLGVTKQCAMCNVNCLDLGVRMRRAFELQIDNLFNSDLNRLGQFGRQCVHYP